MDAMESEVLYRCPICEDPAPSMAACKIHISRCNDAAHWAYVGNDLHDEIVAGQRLEDMGLRSRLRHIVVTANVLQQLRRTANGILQR